MRAVHLSMEGLVDPLGISYESPRLSWTCEEGKYQSAYQILAESDGRIVWDSGKVFSSKMTYLPWGGEKILSRQRVEWKVKIWDEKGEEGPWSDTAYFERSLTKDDWVARWITGDYRPRKKANRVLQYLSAPKKRYPVDCFRKKITVKGPVKRARIYASACGLYEICIDGKKAGDWFMAPGITDYRKRVQSQTLDVTQVLTLAEHTVTVMLADGWYRGSCGAWGLTNEYGTVTKFIAQIEIVYEDGSLDVIPTDDTWEWSQDGPILFADNKDGEILDAGKEPSYSEKAKITYHRYKGIDLMPVASDNVAVTEHEIFDPVISRTPSGKLLLDMGRNFAGILSFSLEAKAGQKLRFRFGEMLEEGELSQDNIQLKTKHKVTPRQEIEYVCKDGLNEYKNRFSIFGYQYVEVTGEEELLTKFEAKEAKVQGIAVYSDFTATGWFESSNPLLNRFVENTVWSARSNSNDLPTDCPTRERHGWSGDAQIFFNTAAYLFDYRTFARKYLKDMYDWQRKSGNLPQIAPEGGVDFFMGTMNGSAGWSDAGILIPYRFAKIFGDEKILEDHYEAMARFARFLEKRCGRKQILSRKAKVTGENREYLVNKGPSYGEWAEPADVFVNHWTEQVFPHAEVSTAYSAYVFRLMAEIAGKLDKKPDEEEFRRYAEGCRKAYQELVTTEEYSLDTDRQSLLVRPLYLDLLTEEQKRFAKKRLMEAMEKYRWRLGTGFLSTPFILDVLKSIDPEAAYRLLENEEVPGWLSMPKQGATSIWESWEGPGNKKGNGIGSLNHYSKGALVEWLFSTMCGIRLDGEKHFTVAPVPGGHFTHAKAVYDSVYGRVEAGWSRTEKGKWSYEITVPSNCTATLILPEENMNGSSKTIGKELEPGTHRF